MKKTINLHEVQRCGTCGHLYPTHLQACPYCNGLVKAAEPTVAPEPVVACEPRQPMDPATKRKLLIICAAVLAVLVLVGVGVAIGHAVSSHSSSSDDDEISIEDSTEMPNTSFDEEDATTDSADETTDGEMDDDSMYDMLCNRELTINDVYDKSADELRIMRNYIYARHGYIFESPDLQEYFSQFDWYTPYEPDMNAVYSSMTETERHNVDFIKQHE